VVFFSSPQNSATWWQTKRPLRKFKCSYLEKKVFSELCACHVWKGMRFHSSGSWGLGGWLSCFLPFFPPKDNSILHQQSSREAWKWNGFRHQFRFVHLVSWVFVHFPSGILSLILIWLSIFWGLVGFMMRCFFLVSFMFLMLSQWWSSITRWSHFIYINAKNFQAIQEDGKICCTKINIVCES